MDSNTRRVAIQSHHEVVVRGFRSMLGDAVGSSAVEVVDLADHPDVVLYDVIGLQTGDGDELARLVRDPEVTVLAVACALRPDLLAQALAKGAHGFVTMDVTAASLAQAVSTARRSGPDTDVGSDRDGRHQQWPAPGSDVRLTGRERDVLGLIARGYSNQEVATRSFLSINSVKTYIRTAYRKIGVTSRSQAVIWCLTHGFPAALPEEAGAPAPAPTPVTALDRAPAGGHPVVRRVG